MVAARRVDEAVTRERGADLIETDLWFLADGDLVCMHDRSLRRLA